VPVPPWKKRQDDGEGDQQDDDPFHTSVGGLVGHLVVDALECPLLVENPRIPLRHAKRAPPLPRQGLVCPVERIIKASVQIAHLKQLNVREFQGDSHVIPLIDDRHIRSTERDTARQGMARLLLGEYLLLSTQDLRDLLCTRRTQLMHVTRGCAGFNLEDGIILVVSLSKKFTLTDMVTGIAYTGVFCLVMCQFVPHRGRKGICLSVVACGPRTRGNFSAAASRHEQEVISLLIEGRTAEELVFHEIATGARDDLARATDIARSMVMHCGMSEKLGPLTYERGHRPQFLDPMLPLPRREVSEEKAHDIGCEVRTLIGEAHEHAQKILETERHTLDTLAHLLLKTATIEGDELRAIMDAGRQQARTHAIAMRVYQLS
jgi:hypothetical protein